MDEDTLLVQAMEAVERQVEKDEGSSEPTTDPKPKKRRVSSAPGKKACGTKEKKIDDAAVKVQAYMEEQLGRPYNSTKIYENMHKEVSHTLVKDALKALTEQGVVCEKETSKTAIYWMNQDTGLVASMTDEEREKMVKGLRESITAKEEQGQEVKQQLKALQDSIVEIETAPCDKLLPEAIEGIRTKSSSLDVTLKELAQTHAHAEALRAKAKSTSSSLQDLQAEIKFYKRFIFERKEAAIPILDSMCEHQNKPLPILMEEAGMEADPPGLSL